MHQSLNPLEYFYVMMEYAIPWPVIATTCLLVGFIVGVLVMTREYKDE